MLPKPQNAGNRPTTAEIKLRTGGATRTIRVPALNVMRIPIVEHIESLARGGATVGGVRTLWTVYDAEGEQHWEIPCHPGRTRRLRSMIGQLTDQKYPVAVGDRPSAELLRIDWVDGEKGWQTRLHKDGRLYRTDANGKTRTFHVPVEDFASLNETIRRMDKASAKDACNDTY